MHSQSLPPDLDTQYFHHCCPFPITEVPALGRGFFHSLSDKLLNSRFCFFKRKSNQQHGVPSILAASSSPRTPSRCADPLSEVVPAHPVLGCPVLPSEDEEAGKTGLTFWNCPQDTSFLSKEQRTVAEREPVGTCSWSQPVPPPPR